MRTQHMQHVDRIDLLHTARVAVVRALPGLGDMLCAVPALRALRTALPEAHITLVGLPAAAWFVERFARYVDDLLEFPGYPGIPELPLQVRRLPAFFSAAQGRYFDLALQLHGSGAHINPFTMLLGARTTAGCFIRSEHGGEHGDYCVDMEHFLPYPSGEHEVRRQLRLLEFLGVPLQGEALEFPLRDADRRDLASIAAARSLRTGEYVCIHPGASLPVRRWPEERFAAVADVLAAQGLRIVLTGSAAEAGVSRAVAARMRTAPLDLTGRTSLGALAALLAGARLLIANDTGVAHLGVALDVASVTIYTTSDPRRWAPLDRRRHRAVCRDVLFEGCGHATCSIEHPCRRNGCTAPVWTAATVRAAAVPAANVLAAANELLQQATPMVAATAVAPGAKEQQCNVCGF